MFNIENLKDLIIYQSQNNENISVEVLYNEEDFWLTQKSMSKLFNVAENNITYHLQNIFKTGELEESSTTQKIRVVQNEGTRKVAREVTFYNLDAIIAVGYRVNSKEATDFRIWATKTLKEYIKKGFVINSEILKNGPKFGKDCDNFIFDGTKDHSFPMIFTDKDLYFAIHGSSLYIKGKKFENKWNLVIKLHDRYDYSKPKMLDQYYNDTNSVAKSLLSSTLYNLASISVYSGVMKEYDIDVILSVIGFEVI